MILSYTNATTTTTTTAAAAAAAAAAATATTTTTTTTTTTNVRVEPALSSHPQGRLSDCLIQGDCLRQVARNTV